MRDSGGKTNRTPLTSTPPAKPDTTPWARGSFLDPHYPRGASRHEPGGTWKGRPALCLSQGLQDELQGHLAPHANILQLCEQSCELSLASPSTRLEHTFPSGAGSTMPRAHETSGTTKMFKFPLVAKEKLTLG